MVSPDGQWRAAREGGGGTAMDRLHASHAGRAALFPAALAGSEACPWPVPVAMRGAGPKPQPGNTLAGLFRRAMARGLHQDLP
jgi:hypothetical protein